MTLEPRRAAWVALAIAAVVGLGTLRATLLADDHFMRGNASGRYQKFSKGPWDLYVFATGNPDEIHDVIERGPYVWWATDQLKIRFFRPLSSLSLWADVKLFGEKMTWPAHLHTVLWFLLLVGAAIAVLRRLLPPKAAAIAMVLFAIDDAHWLPVTWLANRHALVAGAPALWGFWAWLVWRLDGKKWALPLALSLFAVGLTGSEVALGALAFVGAWELVGSTDPWQRRARALVPAVLLGLVYLAVYRALGFGTFGSMVYVDPGTQPGLYLAQAGPRLLALLGGLTLGFVSDAWVLHPLAPRLLATIGALGVVLWALTWRAFRSSVPQEAHRPAAALALGTVLCLLPSLATFPSDRMLLLPSLGGAALLGLFVSVALERNGALAKTVLALVAVLHLLLPAVLWWKQPAGMARTEEAFNRAFFTEAIPDAKLQGRVLYLVAPDFIAGMYPPLYRMSAGRGVPESWNVLSMAPVDHRLTRIDERTFELEVTEGRMLDSTWETLFRDPGRFPFTTGEPTRLAFLTVTPVAVDDGHPTRLRVALDDPPERYTIVTWANGTLVPATLPEPGQTVVLPAEEGPMAKEMGPR